MGRGAEFGRHGYKTLQGLHMAEQIRSPVC